MKSLLLCFGLMCVLKLSAQTLSVDQDSHPTANAFSNEFGSAYAALHCPAGLLNVNGFFLSVAGERKYLIPELGSVGLYAVLPMKNDFFGFELRKSGTAGSGQSSAALAYCRKINAVGLALKCSYFQWNFKGYGASGSFYPELAASVRILAGLQLGISLGNAGFVNLLPRIKQFSSAYKFSLGFTSDSNLFAGIEVRSVSSNASVDGLISYKFGKRLTVSIGVSSGTGSYSLSAGVRLKFIEALVTIGVHPQLGATPAILFNYQKQVAE